MGKILNTYRGYSTSTLKSRSDIPAQVDITEGSGFIDCDNIKIGSVKTVLVEDNYRLSDLSTSDKINEYSYFNSGFWKIDTGVITFAFNSTLFKLGDLAGYNHSAPSPSKSSYNTAATIPQGGGDVSVIATINVGEIDWPNVMFSNINSVKMVVKQGSTIKGTHTISYTDSTHQSGFSMNDNIYLSASTTLTAYFYFYDSTADLAIPTVTSHSIVCTLSTAAEIGTVELDSILQGDHPSWVLIYNESTSGLNQSNETYTLNSLAIDDDDDGEGDVSRFNMTLWSRVNGAKWQETKTGINIAVSGINLVDEALPFNITDGDIVDFELRDGV